MEPAEVTIEVHFHGAGRCVKYRRRRIMQGKVPSWIDYLLNWDDLGAVRVSIDRLPLGENCPQHGGGPSRGR